MNKVHLTLRLPQDLLDFVRAYGDTDTKALENALNKFKQLEQAQEQNQNREQDQKALDRLAFLKEKERIKTEALKERLRERQKQRPTHAARVDWGEGYSGDSDSKYDDDWGDNF